MVERKGKQTGIKGIRIALDAHLLWPYRRTVAHQKKAEHQNHDHR